MNIKLIDRLEGRTYLKPEKGPLYVVGRRDEKTVVLMRAYNSDWSRIVTDVTRDGLGVVVHTTRGEQIAFPEVLVCAHIPWNATWWKKTSILS